MAKPYVKLGELLIAEGLLTQEQLLKAIDLQKKNPEERLGSILVKSGMVAEKNMVMALSGQLNIPFGSLDNDLLKPAVDQSLEKIVPEEFARRYHVLPLFRQGNALTVAMTDPTDLVLIDNLRLISESHIHRVIATQTDLDAAISRFYGEGGMLKSAQEAVEKSSEIFEPKKNDEQLSLNNIIAGAEKAPVINFTDLLISQAIRDRASDVHIEPYTDKVVIRFRIDGVLTEVSSPDKAMHLPLVSRLKIISRMDISEKRLPQDGNFSAKIDDREVDFRVSTIPTINGEKMVFRILDRRATSMSLEKMGLDAEGLARFRKTIRRPHGLILITGPTGSGKTTTLYSALNELNGPDKNILTVEDPVEYQIPGINQVNVKASIGLTFASGLRAFLRQDPDIVMVGEVRDLETAQICVRAALTGHTVFSTLHTNDAPSTINRLIDIGIEPFFVSSSLLMIVAQRLVRRLCQKCKESYAPAAGHLPANFVLKAKHLYKPKGCEHCAKTGYLGRLPIFEILYMTEAMEDLVAKGANTTEIRALALKSGMQTLEQNAFDKVNDGITSLDEAIRLTMAQGA